MPPSPKTAPASPAFADETTLPLCVDLDGTLLRSDLLWESLARLLKARPWEIPLLPFWLMAGRAALKRRLTQRITIDATTLPYHEPFLAYLRAEKARGRPLFLVTASDATLAHGVARHLGLFDGVLASDGTRNLRGSEKAAELVSRFGSRGFDYAGDSIVDLPVWAEARQAVLVGAGTSVAGAVRARTPVRQEFARPPGAAPAIARLLRPHQWVKNLILFVPLITSHQIFQMPQTMHAFLAFVAFCACASGVYVLNDLLDLEADRRHATKRLRPLASGAFALSGALGLGPALLLAGLALAAAISLPFLAVMAIYVAVAFLYSWRLKRTVLVDVFVLAGLYTLRLIAGHIVTGVQFSDWLLAFSMFLFLSLALVKRYQELRGLPALPDSRVAGRDYRADDLELLTPLGAASGYLSVLVLALYVSSENVRLLYQQPRMLLLICPLMLYWISRVWLVAHRGAMHDDPVVFALKDKVSYLVGLLTLAVVWLAK